MVGCEKRLALPQESLQAKMIGEFACESIHDTLCDETLWTHVRWRRHKYTNRAAFGHVVLPQFFSAMRLVVLARLPSGLAARRIRYAVLDGSIGLRPFRNPGIVLGRDDVLTPIYELRPRLCIATFRIEIRILVLQPSRGGEIACDQVLVTRRFDVRENRTADGGEDSSQRCDVKISAGD